MKQHKYERMDKGIKRGKKNVAQVNARENGRFLPVHSPETRATAIADALVSLERGETTQQIAARYSIPASTLRSWLIGDPRADEARRLMLASEISSTIEQIEAAADPLSLARARELNRSWCWIAERRLPAHYGQHSHVTIENVTDLGERLRRARERTIEGEAHTIDTVPAQAIEDKGL